MSMTKPTVLESFKLAEQLLDEIKQHKTKNQQLQAKVYQIPKWLLGRERLYAPNKKGINENVNRMHSCANYSYYSATVLAFLILIQYHRYLNYQQMYEK